MHFFSECSVTVSAFQRHIHQKPGGSLDRFPCIRSLSREVDTVSHPLQYLHLPAVTLDLSDGFLDHVTRGNETAIVLFHEFGREGGAPFFMGIPVSGGTADRRSNFHEGRAYARIARHLLRECQEKGRHFWSFSALRNVLRTADRLLRKSGRVETFSEVEKAWLLFLSAESRSGRTAADRQRKRDEMARSLQISHNCSSPEAALLRIHIRVAMAEEEDPTGEFGPALRRDLARVSRNPEFLQRLGHVWDLAHLHLWAKPPSDGPVPKTDSRSDPMAGAPSLRRRPFFQPPPGLDSRPEAVVAPGEADLQFLASLPLGHPGWKATLLFLKRTFQRKAPPRPAAPFSQADPDAPWRFAIPLWGVIEEKLRAPAPLELQRHESVFRDASDLAFLSALEINDLPLAARIADAVKSRPARHWRGRESRRARGVDSPAEGFMQERAQIANGQFIKTPARAEIPPLAENGPFPDRAAEGSLIVQFYLVKMNGFARGYALICGTDGWREWREFDPSPLRGWHRQWRRLYFSIPPRRRSRSSEMLPELCRTLGKTFSFLFDMPEAQTGTSPALLLIPHDFLHQLPLHGSCRGEREFLLHFFRCTYLPALHFAHAAATSTRPAWKAFSNIPELHAHRTDAAGNEGRGGAMEASDRDQLETMFQSFRFTFGMEHLRSLRPPVPEVIALFCHGSSHPLNPLSSGLETTPRLKLSEFLKARIDFCGATLVLSACESDFGSGSDFQMDEHYSFSAAFLQKGAARVLGILWETDYPMVMDVLKGLKQGGLESVRRFLARLLEDAHLEREPENLFHALTFKIYSAECLPGTFLARKETQRQRHERISFSGEVAEGSGPHATRAGGDFAPRGGRYCRRNDGRDSAKLGNHR